MAEKLNNGQIAAFFDRLGDVLQLQGANQFKVRAYHRAADTIRGLPRDIHTDYQAGSLKEIPGIGDAIADKIAEIIETGRLRALDKEEAKVPAGVAELMEVPEIGAKTAMTIYEALGIDSLDMLEEAARAGRLKEVSGIGPRTEARILAGIEAIRRRSDRLLLGVVLPRAEELLATLQDAAGPRLLQASLTGSLRRRFATVGDINLLAAAREGEAAALADAFAALPQVGEVLDREEARVRARLHSGEAAELYIVRPEEWGGALQFFTGSREHNERLMALARQQGLTLEGRGLASNGERLALAQESDLYERLGLPWIPPELREDRGEIEAALAGDLPQLVERANLRGDLHMHSRWSDGKATILEMAQAARDAGYEYIVITDHSQSLAMAGGLSPERLIEQRYEIINANIKVPGITVLQGAEVEIKADGSLDYDDDVLATLDIVVASMHTGIRGDRETLTRRMLNAIRNPHVDIIGHMTNRLIGRREGADLDMEAVLQAAAETGTILEINAQPDRLDLDPTHARQALEYGCLLSVDSDAHSTGGLEAIRFGVMQARRAWAEPEDIINTRSLEELLSYIQGDDEEEEEE